MTYAVEVTADAARALRSLEKHARVRIQATLRELAEQSRPSGVKKLRGEKNAWRVRVGDYRIVYEIHDAVLVVLVVRIAHRRDVYSR